MSLNYKVREATIDDCDEIIRLIQGLAVYEKEPASRVKITKETLERDGFGTNKWFWCRVVECIDENNLNNSKKEEITDLKTCKQIVGFVLYFRTYSTWDGRSLKVEDLYVDESHRGNGAGSMLLKTVAMEALAVGCKKIHWCVLRWNEPAINFYKSINSKYEEEWGVVYFYENEMRNFCK